MSHGIGVEVASPLRPGPYDAMLSAYDEWLAVLAVALTSEVRRSCELRQRGRHGTGP